MIKPIQLKELSTIFILISFVIIINNVHKTRETEHFNYLWLSLMFIAYILLVIYGILIKNKSIYLPGFFILFGLIFIIYTKISTKFT